jgi:hypothetical protein
VPDQRRLARSLLRYKDHPVTRAAARRGDAQDRAVAAEAASCAEAALAEVRRGAGIEPPVVFARTVDRAVHEVRAIAAQYWTPEVAAWQRTALRELGALLFEHVVETQEVEMTVVDRALRAARRDGFA